MNPTLSGTCTQKFFSVEKRLSAVAVADRNRGEMYVTSERTDATGFLGVSDSNR